MMEHYILFIFICAGVASLGILIGGIGLLVIGIRTPSTVDSPCLDISCIESSLSEMAFGINKSGIAIAARLMIVPCSVNVNLVDYTNALGSGASASTRFSLLLCDF